VCRDDLNEEKEGLWVGIVVLLQLGSDRLQVLGVGWRITKLAREHAIDAVIIRVPRREEYAEEISETWSAGGGDKDLRTCVSCRSAANLCLSMMQLVCSTLDWNGMKKGYHKTKEEKEREGCDGNRRLLMQAERNEPTQRNPKRKIWFSPKFPGVETVTDKIA
jgi:hypothetical protein